MGGSSKSSQESDVSNSNREITTIDNRIAEDDSYIGGNVNIAIDGAKGADDGGDTTLSAKDSNHINNINVQTTDAQIVENSLLFANSANSQALDFATQSNSEALESNALVMEALQEANEASLKELAEANEANTKALAKANADNTKALQSFGIDALQELGNAHEESNDIVFKTSSSAFDSLNEALEINYDTSESAMDRIVQANANNSSSLLEMSNNAMKFAEDSTKSEASLALTGISENFTKVAITVGVVSGVYIFFKGAK